METKPITKPTTKKKEQETGSFPLGAIVTILIGIVGMQRYLKFTDFIKTVRFRLKIIENHQKKIIVLISPIARLGIPYAIKNIEIVLDGRVWKVQDCELQEMIVANSNIPVTLHAMEAAKTASEPSIMAVTYSLFGFSVKRGYQPEITRVSNDLASTVEQKQPQFSKKQPQDFQKKACSCTNNHKS